MKHYLVQTGWDEHTDNLHPGKVRRYPQHRGNIEVMAINDKVAEMAVIVDHIHLNPVIKEICAKHLIGTKLMPKQDIPILCGSKLLIAN